LQGKFGLGQQQQGQWLWLGMVAIALAIGGCNALSPRPPLDQSLNSRFNDEQPSLSGDGRWLAFVSNRNGTREILVYDLRNNQLVTLPGLNQTNVIAESPSLSRTGRYLVYLSSVQGRPDVALYDRLTRRTDLLTLNYRQWVRNPHISPDGRYIVFETARRGQWDLEIYDRGPQIELDIPDGVVIEAPPGQP